MSQSSAQTVTMIEMVFPDQTNHYGTLFGGHALRLMDKAAFVAASRHARKAVVTACSERVDFRAAVRHGSLVELTALVVATGRTSMTVSVDLIAEDLLSGNRQLCAQGRFVLVALDENQRPTAVPQLSASPNELPTDKGNV
jgi:acyl-CoA hydrolase